MYKKSSLQLIYPRSFRYTFSILVCLIVGKALVLGAGMSENFAKMDNDDIMRLAMVRDLIAGQSWFDTTQYRVLPPDGLSLHWSRYIDAGIASIIFLVSLFFKMDAAEQIAVAVWPTLIHLLQLAVVGFGTCRVFGATAGCFAMMCLVSWSVTGFAYVRPGKIDHHNVQMLLMFIMLFSVVWPQGSARAGLVAGFSAAFSLAVGLESILFILIAGLIMVLHAAYGQNQRRLFAFCCALLTGCFFFWLGQASPATTPSVCDQLGTPLLSLIGVACAASIFPHIFIGSSGKPLVILSATILVAGFGIFQISPLLSPCSAGPYGALPDEVQAIIKNNIVESLPVFTVAKKDAVVGIVILLPVIAAVLSGSVRCLPACQEADFYDHTALRVLLVFSFFGLCMLFYQARTVVVAATVVPIIAGVELAYRYSYYKKNRNVKNAFPLIATLLVFFAPHLIGLSLKPMFPQHDGIKPTGNKCHNYASLKLLNDAPPGLMLADINFGSRIIWATHHDALSAPYHRSAAAYRNGIIPFTMEEAEAKTYILATNADYLLLCRGAMIEGKFTTSLVAGERVDWLEPITLADPNLMLFMVKRK